MHFVCVVRVEECPRTMNVVESRGNIAYIRHHANQYFIPKALLHFCPEMHLLQEVEGDEH